LVFFLRMNQIYQTWSAAAIGAGDSDRDGGADIEIYVDQTQP
jgi:hypothetical protein